MNMILHGIGAPNIIHTNTLTENLADIQDRASPDELGCVPSHSRTRGATALPLYNAFSAFPEDALVRINPKGIRKKGKVPKNGSLFFTIFQTFMRRRSRRSSRLRRSSPPV